MINISLAHIITDKRRIKNTIDKTFYVLPPNQEQQCLNEFKLLKERTYMLDCGQADYEIICPTIQKDGIIYLCIPEFLIFGRPYPIYVYLYGIILYSSNPKMGQREAAEKTRKHFSLETFSHTTLGRSIKKLEAQIKELWNNPESEELSCIGKKPVTQRVISQIETTGSEHSGCFPCVEQTRERRDTVISFLAGAAEQNNHKVHEILQQSHKYKRLPYTGDFIDVCHKIVGHIFKKYRSLLL